VAPNNHVSFIRPIGAHRSWIVLPNQRFLGSPDSARSWGRDWPLRVGCCSMQHGHCTCWGPAMNIHSLHAAYHCTNMKQCAEPFVFVKSFALRCCDTDVPKRRF
jgi:hypothetical protein